MNDLVRIKLLSCKKNIYIKKDDLNYKSKYKKTYNFGNYS